MGIRLQVEDREKRGSTKGSIDSGRQFGMARVWGQIVNQSLIRGSAATGGFGYHIWEYTNPAVGRVDKVSGFSLRGPRGRGEVVGDNTVPELADRALVCFSSRTAPANSIGPAYYKIVVCLYSLGCRINRGGERGYMRPDTTIAPGYGGIKKGTRLNTLGNPGILKKSRECGAVGSVVRLRSAPDRGKLRLRVVVPHRRRQCHSSKNTVDLEGSQTSTEMNA